MTYATRRRMANGGGLLAAAGLTTALSLALGGTLPSPVPDTLAGPPRERTVERELVVRKIVEGVEAAARRRSGGPASKARAATPAGGGDVPLYEDTAPADGGAGSDPRRRRPPKRKTPSARTPAPAVPAASVGAPAPGGGYRAFAAATAARVGELTLARSGSGVALDGKLLDVADELGSLMPAADGRTAFGRALAASGGASSDAASPPAGPATSSSGGGGSAAEAAARTDASGACVRGEPVSSAEARSGATGDGPLRFDAARSRTESVLDPQGRRFALTTRALAEPPRFTAGDVTVAFLGPVVLTARAGGTPGSAAVELGPEGRDRSAPLVEVRTTARTLRYTAAEVLGGSRIVRLGSTTLVIGGVLRAWRGAPDTAPIVSDDGTSAAAAADLLSVTHASGARIVLGHVEAAVAVPAGGVTC